MTFGIRIARATDAAGILSCLAEAFEPYRASYTHEAFLDTVLTPQTLEQRLKSMNVLVAIAPPDRVIGTVACAVADEAEGHLRGMAVRQDWQGSGVALQLLASAESHFRACGCTRITLDTTAPLVRAMKFYARQGFRRSGRVQDFFGMQLFEYVKDIAP